MRRIACLALMPLLFASGCDGGDHQQATAAQPEQISVAEYKRRIAEERKQRIAGELQRKAEAELFDEEVRILGLPDCDRALIRTMGNRMEGMYESYQPYLVPKISEDQFKLQYLLMTYSTTGHLEEVTKIVESGRVDIDYILRTDDDAPALAWAARCNRVKVIKYLLAHGANVNIRFSYGIPPNVIVENATPLSWAGEFESREAARVLRRYGAVEVREMVTRL